MGCPAARREMYVAMTALPQGGEVVGGFALAPVLGSGYAGTTSGSLHRRRE